MVLGTGATRFLYHLRRPKDHSDDEKYQLTSNYHRSKVVTRTSEQEIALVQVLGLKETSLPKAGETLNVSREQLTLLIEAFSIFMQRGVKIPSSINQEFVCRCKATPCHFLLRAREVGRGRYRIHTCQSHTCVPEMHKDFSICTNKSIIHFFRPDIDSSLIQHGTNAAAEFPKMLQSKYGIDVLSTAIHKRMIQRIFAKLPAAVDELPSKSLKRKHIRSKTTIVDSIHRVVSTDSVSSQKKARCGTSRSLVDVAGADETVMLTSKRQSRSSDYRNCRNVLQESLHGTFRVNCKDKAIQRRHASLRLRERSSGDTTTQSASEKSQELPTKHSKRRKECLDSCFELGKRKRKVPALLVAGKKNEPVSGEPTKVVRTQQNGSKLVRNSSQGYGEIQSLGKMRQRRKIDVFNSTDENKPLFAKVKSTKGSARHTSGKRAITIEVGDIEASDSLEQPSDEDSSVFCSHESIAIGDTGNSTSKVNSASWPPSSISPTALFAKLRQYANDGMIEPLPDHSATIQTAYAHLNRRLYELDRQFPMELDDDQEEDVKAQRKCSTILSACRDRERLTRTRELEEDRQIHAQERERYLRRKLTPEEKEWKVELEELQCRKVRWGVGHRSGSGQAYCRFGTSCGLCQQCKGITTNSNTHFYTPSFRKINVFCDSDQTSLTTPARPKKKDREIALAKQVERHRFLLSELCASFYFIREYNKGFPNEQC